MIKKFLPVLLCAMLAFSMYAAANGTESSSQPQAPLPPHENAEQSEKEMPPAPESSETPQNEEQTPPMPPDGQMPPMPSDGQMPPPMPPDGQMPPAPSVDGSSENQMRGGRMRNMPPGGQMPANGNPGEGFSPEEATQNFLSLKEILKEYQTPFISLILLVFAFIFVIFYKRKNY